MTDKDDRFTKIHNPPVPSTMKTVINLLLFICAPLPSIWAAFQLHKAECSKLKICEMMQKNELLAVNILLFVNLDFGFWFIGVL